MDLNKPRIKKLLELHPKRPECWVVTADDTAFWSENDALTYIKSKGLPLSEVPVKVTRNEAMSWDEGTDTSDGSDDAGAAKKNGKKKKEE